MSRAQLRENLDIIAIEINDLTYHTAAIPDVPMSYRASTCGHIISSKHNEPRVLKENINSRGKLLINIYAEGKSKRMQVHRLIAMAYFENADCDASGTPRTQVNHIDGNTTVNSVCNLEWCSDSENKCHARDVLEADDFKHIAELNRRPQYGNNKRNEALRNQSNH